MILPPPQPPPPAPESAEPETAQSGAGPRPAEGRSGTEPETAEGAPAAPKLPLETAWWLLSLFTPAPQDAVDWQRGFYGVTTRGGRVESPAGSGAPKKLLRMVEEGSVLVCDGPPRGAASDVAPDGFAHPVYRAGFALAIPVPLRQPERPLGAL